MAWTTPATVVADTTELTADLWNEQVRDNTDYLKAEADAVGLVAITTTTITASSAAVSFNNVFTSAYRNYRIVFDMKTSGNNQAIVRMRGSGVDASGAGTYVWSRYYWVATNNPVNNGGSNSDNKGIFLDEATSNRGSVGFWDVYRPAIAEETVWVGLAAYSNLYEGGGIVHDVSTAYDGFTFDPVSNVTGRISVYGYREA